MKTLTKQKVRYLYKVYKRRAQNAYNKRRYNTCVNYLTAASYTAYTFYMGFKDDDLEDLLLSLSKQISPKVDQPIRNDNECIFFDSFSIDNGGLTQQYLGALISCGYKIRYICLRDYVLSESSDIGRMLRDYGKAEIVVVPHKLCHIKKAQYIYDCIMGTQAARLFIHSSPKAAAENMAFYALPSSIKKYKINLTDHTFWIGTRFIDYSLEFRPYGGMVSILHRGISFEKILYLPFFPIMSHKKFKGFPVEVEGKVILFSGGSYYKIFDSENSFFKLSKAILDACPNVILLFAGSGDTKEMNEKIDYYHLKGQFIPIGRRLDITEVFEHSDIYLNTYPIGGGLMSQYAAQLGKPIVNYHTSISTPVEDHVCQKQYVRISSDSIEDLVNRVKHFVADKDFRKQFGNEMRNCVVTPLEFNDLFAKCMVSGTNPLPYRVDKAFKTEKLNINDKLAYENATKDFQRFMVKFFGLASLWECPIFILPALYSLVKGNRLVKAIRNNI